MPPTETISPALFDSLGDLSLVAREVVEGFLSGLHRSPFLGYSTEFAAYRPYMQGDNLRHVDWKVWGRTDELYVKQFEDDTNLFCQLFLDTSASMNFGQPNKFHYARVLAAALAYLMTRQHDATGLVLFGDQAVQALPARSKADHLDEIFSRLSATEARGRTQINASLWQIVDLFTRRGLSVVISDMLSTGDALFELLRRLRAQRQQVILFHVLSPEELDFKYEGQMLVEDSETGEKVPIHADTFRPEYLARLQDFLQRAEQTCQTLEIDYRRLRTDEPLDRALTIYLEERMAG
jgi:uncharacterized protein (DUF58 family)